MTSLILNKSRKVTLLLLTLVSSLILLPSFLLLMASSWNSDDYFIAKLYQVQGLNGLFERIFGWSPRFFSEIILYIYYNSVPWLGKPFTGSIILLIWLFLISSIFIFTRDTIKKNSLVLLDKKEHLADNKINKKTDNIYLQLLLPLLITLILLAYFLFSQRPSAMFYLVVVSFAYVSTLVGIIFNLNFFINQSDAHHISVSNICQLVIFGIITSSSWEMGSIYQLFFSSCLFLLLLLNTFSSKLNFLPFSGLNKCNRWKLSIANLIPFCLSLYVLFLLNLNRVGSAEANNMESPLTGNFLSSFMTALWQFLKEIFFLNSPSWKTNTDFYSFTYSVVYKLSFLLLLTILFYLAKVKLNKISQSACFFSIIPLVITNFTITFSSYYQLGTITAPRQTSFKSGLIGLIIVILALIFASLLSHLNNNQNHNRNIYLFLNSPLTLLINFSLTMALLINLQFDHLTRDLSNFQNLLISNHQNWQENLNSKESFGIYTNIGTSYIFRMYLHDGFYPSCDQSEGNNDGAGRYAHYFNKQKLYVFPFESGKLNDRFDRISQEKKSIDGITYFDCPFAIFGNIEQINQYSWDIVHSGEVMEVTTNQNVEITGWAINPDQSKAKMMIITIENNQNLLLSTPLDLPRPDVAEYFGDPNLINSKWKAIFKPSPEWGGETITFKVWTYDPLTKIANFNQKFKLHFSSDN